MLDLGKNLTTCPNTGVQHLWKLELVPENFGRNMMQQEAGEDITTSAKQGDKGKSFNPLLVQTKFDYDSDLNRNKECGCSNVNIQSVPRMQIKSGKFVKSNVNIVRQEVWPHTAVSKKYTKRTSFDNLDFEAFTAGEAKIIHSMMISEPDKGHGKTESLHVSNSLDV